MYVGLLLVVIGQALLFGSLGLLLYAAVVWFVTASFVRWYEEPTPARQYGSEYEAYRRNVHAWVPRWRPWPAAQGPAHFVAVFTGQHDVNNDRIERVFARHPDGVGAVVHNVNGETFRLEPFGWASPRTVETLP